MIAFIKEISVRRTLIYELVLKNLKVRYSRPMLGFLWAFLSPVFMVGIFYIVFSLILKVEIKEAPFILYLMSAVFPWSFFQDSVVSSSTSLVDNRNLIKESALPHYLIPVSIVLANAINFLPSLCILIIAILFMTGGLPIFIAFLPLTLITHLAMTLGFSIIISILYVKYRDIKYLLDVAMLLLFYLTPVFYSLELVKSAFSPFLFKIYLYNPFVGLCNFYRITFFRGFHEMIKKDVGLLSIVLMPFFFALGMLALSLFYYRKNKLMINDYLSY